MYTSMFDVSLPAACTVAQCHLLFMLSKSQSTWNWATCPDTFSPLLWYPEERGVLRVHRQSRLWCHGMRSKQEWRKCNCKNILQPSLSYRDNSFSASFLVFCVGMSTKSSWYQTKCIQNRSLITLQKAAKLLISEELSDLRTHRNSPFDFWFIESREFVYGVL